MRRRRTAAALGLLVLGAALSSCRDPGRSAKSAADAFVDRYYIERNHARALELATGAAADRVTSEQKLVEGAGGAYGEPPKIYYKLRKTQAKGDLTQLEYDLTVSAGGSQLKKDVQVLVRKVGDRYKVAYFQERDLTGS